MYTENGGGSLKKAKCFHLAGQLYKKKGKKQTKSKDVKLVNPSVIILCGDDNDSQQWQSHSRALCAC